MFEVPQYVEDGTVEFQLNVWAESYSYDEMSYQKFGIAAEITLTEPHSYITLRT